MLVKIPVKEIYLAHASIPIVEQQFHEGNAPLNEKFLIILSILFRPK